MLLITHWTQYPEALEDIVGEVVVEIVKGLLVMMNAMEESNEIGTRKNTGKEYKGINQSIRL